MIGYLGHSLFGVTRKSPQACTEPFQLELNS